MNVIDITKQLVAIPSVSGSETDILTFCEQWLHKHNFQNIIRTDVFCSGKVPGTAPSNALILCGHVDTVAPGNLTAWHTDPYTATEKDGKLYGLGVSDMKAGLAVQMSTAIDYAKHPGSHDLFLVFVAGEEVDGAGSAAFTDYFKKTYSYQHGSCLIAEPTDNTRIEIGHRGNAFTTFTFTGQAGHGSQQESFALSALKKATEFLGGISSSVTEIADRSSHDILGTPTIVPTCIQGGDMTSMNKTSDTVTVTCDIRTTPAIEPRLAMWLNAISNKYGSTWEFCATPTPSCICDESAPVVAAVKKTTGITTVSASRGATDQVFFQQIGIDTVVFGPGLFNQAHAQNEYIIIDDILKAAATYTHVVKLLTK